MITGVEIPPLQTEKFRDLSLTSSLNRSMGGVSNEFHLLRSNHIAICDESETASFNEWSLIVAIPRGLTPLYSTLIWYKKKNEITLRTD